jgi:hypothetical protein
MLLSEIFGEEPNDWRVWIDATGKVHEVTGDVTHAEYVYFKRDGADDGDIDGEGVDESFDDAINAGWIRVGINLISFEFFATGKLEAITPASIETLLRIVNSHHADFYTLDFGGAHQSFERTKQVSTFLTRLLIQKKRSA